MEMRYCRRCGTELTESDSFRYTCKNQHTLFLNAAPGVGIFLFDIEGFLLLSVRGIEPNKGKLDNFGGFVDAHETVEEALIREVHEELNLQPEHYTEPVYLTSGTNLYRYGGEGMFTVSSLFYAKLAPDATPIPQDDVAAIHRVQLSKVVLEDIAHDDTKKGIIMLQQLNLSNDS